MKKLTARIGRQVKLKIADQIEHPDLRFECIKWKCLYVVGAWLLLATITVHAQVDFDGTGVGGTIGMESYTAEGAPSSPPSEGDGGDNSPPGYSSSDSGSYSTPLPPHVHENFWGSKKPDEGWAWDNDDPNDFSVHPLPPGTRSKHRHVLWEGDGESLRPELGWTWRIGSHGQWGNKNKFRVEPLPDGVPSKHLHLVWNGRGLLRPQSGWRWVNASDSTDNRVEPLPAGAPSNYPHVVWNGNGRLDPAEGWVWVNANDSVDNRVEPLSAGTPYDNHPNVVWTGDGTHVRPANGYRFISRNPASTGDYGVEPITVSLIPAKQIGQVHANDRGVPPPIGNSSGPDPEQHPPVIDVHRLFEDPRIASGIEVVKKMNLDGFEDMFRDVAKHSDPRVEELDVRLRSAEGQVDMAKDVFDALQKVAAGDLTDEEARKIQSLDSQLVINLFRKICDDPSLKVENYRKDFDSGKK